MAASRTYLELEREIDDLRRLLWQRDLDNQRLLEELDHKEKQIEDLKSQLDKFQSVLFLRPSHSTIDLHPEDATTVDSGHLSVPGQGPPSVADPASRKKRIAISAEPQRQTQELLGSAKHHPKSDRSALTLIAMTCAMPCRSSECLCVCVSSGSDGRDNDRKRVVNDQQAVEINGASYLRRPSLARR